MLKNEFSKVIEELIESNKEKFKSNGKIIEGRTLSRNYIAKYVLNVSGTWFSGIVNGEKEPSDEVVIKLANYFEVDERYFFYLLQRVHPNDYEVFKKDYLEKLKLLYT